MASEDLDKLLSHLASSDGAVRNRAALRLRDLRDDWAVEPLFRAIHTPANKDNCGTLVYALRYLDCSEHFSDLFQFALHGNYEVQCMALAILEEQDFAVAAGDLATATEDLAAFVANPPPIQRVELLAAQLQAVLVRLDIRHSLGHAL